MEFWELPIFGAFIALLTVWAISWVILRWVLKHPETIARSITDSLIANDQAIQLFEGLLDSGDMETQVQPILDTRLDHLVDTLKVKIPMANMFLTGPMVEQLKAVAKEELIKIIPDIKNLLVEKLREGNQLDLLLNQCIYQGLRLFLVQSIQPKVSVWLTKACAYAVTGGLVLGVIERLIYYFVL